MPSNLYVGMQQRIENLKKALLAEKDDLDADAEDQLRAVAYRVLASATIEEFVEKRCVETAKTGIERFKKGDESSTARALVTWLVVRNTPDVVPLEPGDVKAYFHLLDEAFKAYSASASNNHGLDARDLRNLVHPVGLRSHQVPEELADRLQALADKRNPSVHTSTLKVTRRTNPGIERDQVDTIVALLERLDDELEIAATTYPIAAPAAASL